MWRVQQAENEAEDKCALTFKNAKLNNWNFHSLEVVSHYGDPQLQVIFVKIETKHLQILMFNIHLTFHPQ